MMGDGIPFCISKNRFNQEKRDNCILCENGDNYYESELKNILCPRGSITED